MVGSPDGAIASVWCHSIWRCGVVAWMIAGAAAAQNAVSAWYPFQPGDSWTYQKESLDGNMALPDWERWTTEETIVSAAPVTDLAAILVTKKDQGTERYALARLPARK